MIGNSRLNKGFSIFMKSLSLNRSYIIFGIIIKILELSSKKSPLKPKHHSFSFQFVHYPVITIGAENRESGGFYFH